MFSSSAIFIFNGIAPASRRSHPGKNDVCKAFKTFLRDDIDEEEWETVAKTVSRPIPRPQSGLLAVKVINHFGDEVMKVFHV